MPTIHDAERGLLDGALPLTAAERAWVARAAAGASVDAATGEAILARHGDALTVTQAASVVAFASGKARGFVSGEIEHLMKDKGYPQKRAVAAALNVAREKGEDVPPAPHHAALARFGYARMGGSVSRYAHPDGHVARLMADGDWSHETHGSGANALEEHLGRLHGQRG